MNVELLNEQKFINQLIAGKQAAFSRLLDDYQQKVFGTCISFIPNKEDAEDVSQEVFIAVFKSIHQFKKTRNYLLGSIKLRRINA